MQWIIRLGIVAALALAPACHHSAPHPPSTAAPPESPPQQESQSPADVSEQAPSRPRTEPLSAVARDSLVRDVQARRAAWRARNIPDYQIRVTVGCFCPWPQTPAVLDVRAGLPVALRDTLGVSAGAVREPWSRYTVEGLFDTVERSAREDDRVDVRYEGRFGYPAEIRGDRKQSQVDDWYWVRASHLTPAAR